MDAIAHSERSIKLIHASGLTTLGEVAELLGWEGGITNSNIEEFLDFAEARIGSDGDGPTTILLPND